MINTKVSYKKYRLVFIFLMTTIMFVAISCFAVSMLTANAASSFSGGIGTSGSPYIISTKADLAQLADDVNSGQVNGYYGSYFQLNTNLDLSDYGSSFNNSKGWIPIGDITYPFKGTFDGNGFSIANLYINDTVDNLGLFGYINSDSTVRNLVIESSNVQGRMNIGGIAGRNEGVISNCVYTGNVKSSMMFVGGIAGYNTGTISDSSNSGTIIADMNFAGGIVGTNIGNIYTSYNKGTINGYSCAGGIAGNNEGNISECYNTGLVSGHDTQGGITGTNTGSILNCYNKGSITANSMTAGGVAGSNDNTGIIKNVYNIAAVNAVNIVGALAGYNIGVIEAGFFNKETYLGAAVGGGIVISSAGRSAYEMTSADTLTDSNKLKSITDNNGTGKWVKRTCDSQFSYYPELNVFHNSANSTKKADSKTSAAFGRVTLTAADINLDKISFVYDSTAHEPDILLGTTKLTRNLDYTAVYSNNINAGAENNAKVEITFIDHYIGNVTEYFSITKAPLSITWNNSKIIYNGTAQFPLAYAGDGKIGSENITFVYSGYQSNINAGEHSVTASLDNTSINNNYYFEPFTHTYTVEKSPITLTWDTATLIYSGSAQFHSATVASGKIGAENITLKYSGYESNINAIPGSTYTVVAALDDTTINSNYSLEPQTHYYSISKKLITVSWDSSTLYYNANPQYPKINNIIGKIGDEDVTFDYSGYSGNVNASSGNAYNVTANLANTATNLNYDFVSDVKYYDISKAQISVSWSDTELVYDGTAQYPNASVSAGAVNGENVTLEYYNYGSNINASSSATYAVSVKLANTAINANYVFTPETKNYSISKAPLTIAWNAGDLTYNGAVQRPSAYVISGLYLSDTASLSYSSFSGLNAGSGYTITIESLNLNYFISNTLTYSINPAPITVSWPSYELIYNGEAQRPDAVVTSGLFAGDAAGLEYSNFTGINVGSGYTITISSLNGNYYVQNTLTYSISPSPITLTWDNNLKYNGQAQHPTATVGSGKIGGDNIILEYYNYGSNINASSGSAYTVNVRLADNEINKNYVLAITAKTYDISKAEINIAWKSEITYNGQNQHPEAEITSQIYDTVGLIYSNYNSVNAGDGYNITIKSDNANYVVVNSLTYSIGKAKVSIEWSNDNLYYNGASQHLSASISSNIPGAENITFYYSGFESNIKVSTGNFYSVTLVLDSNTFNNNFYLDETAVKYYDILKKAININDVIGIERNYDGTLVIQLSGGELSGVLEGDNVTFVLGDGELNDANAGKNKTVITSIMLSGEDADQYELIQPYDVVVTISKAVIDISGISFSSKNFIYSGTAKNIYIAGDLPIGITVVYSGNEQINAGEYMVTVRFVLDDESNFEPIDSMTAYIYITKASFDISNITFSSQTFAYNGDIYSLYITGDLPSGISVIYENNGQKDVGEYQIIVRFILEDADNYEQIENMSAYLYITQSKYEYTDQGIVFEVSDGYLDHGASINVNKTLNKTLDNGLTALEAFDITFLKDNVEIQPNATIKITLTLSDKTLKQKGLRLVHINAEGETTDVEFEIVNGQLVFYASSFSTYALVADQGSNLLWYLLFGGLALALIAGASIFIIRKRRLAFTTSLNSINAQIPVKTESTSQTIFVSDHETETEGVEVQDANAIDESDLAAAEPILLDTEFNIDGVYCKSFVSFCESLKYKTSSRQIDVCALSAEKAKRNALGKNSWEKRNELYWRDKKFGINSKEHLELLEKAKAAQAMTKEL